MPRGANKLTLSKMNMGGMGLAMINCVINGSDKKVLEARDIAGLAKKTSV